jgi:hypothetical protein
MKKTVLPKSWLKKLSKSSNQNIILALTGPLWSFKKMIEVVTKLMLNVLDEEKSSEQYNVVRILPLF